MGAEGGEDGGIGSSSSSRPRKNNLFERQKGGDGVSADTASAALALTANNGRRNVFSSAGR